jgi:uncharacterized NAD(P)/FAD-binding protein YdhS
VILATGHSWPEDRETDAGHFVSPWSGLIDTAIPAGRVGILGTSLSAIDAAMATACQHGAFDPSDTTFDLSSKGCDLQITLMSRQGLLPEADFWCPLPYRPLRHLTPGAVQHELTAGPDGLLDRLWHLMVAELIDADPVWSSRLRIAELSAQDFAEAYFAPRLSTDAFSWAKANLVEVQRNVEARHTVGWRYAILRMHEPIERAVEHLSEVDRERFGCLKRVFIDNYAAVPPQSIKRLLALHEAGCLTILTLGDDYIMDRHDTGTRVTTESGDVHNFDVFIDARGQRALCSEDLPFPSLRDALPAGQVETDSSFALIGAGNGRIFLPAAPYLLSRLPFVQGITASADMGAEVARVILGCHSNKVVLT